MERTLRIEVVGWSQLLMKRRARVNLSRCIDAALKLDQNIGGSSGATIAVVHIPEGFKDTY